jgi:hypothetical protein
MERMNTKHELIAGLNEAIALLEREDYQNAASKMQEVRHYTQNLAMMKVSSRATFML